MDNPEQRHWRRVRGLVVPAYSEILGNNNDRNVAPHYRRGYVNRRRIRGSGEIAVGDSYDWRARTAELRRLAADADDPERARKLATLAEKWEQAADEAEAGRRASPFSLL